MAFPVRPEELALHERLMAGDVIAPVDAFEKFMDPLVSVLVRDISCTEDEAYDSGIDALLVYLEQPGRYDRSRGRLSTYLAGIAKKKAIDRLRSRAARERREKIYAETVARSARNPKGRVEVAVEARKLWSKVEIAVPSERDRRALGLMLSGERSTQALAEALEIAYLLPAELRRQVKQHRDRLLKVLERLGTRLSHDDKQT